MKSIDSGNTAVPARNGTDVGRDFLFVNIKGQGRPTIAVTGYATADVSLPRLSDGVEVWRTRLIPGQQRINEIPEGAYRLTASGDVSLWSGGIEYGDSLGAYAMSGMTQNTGVRGKRLLVDRQQQATVFAYYDNTDVHVEELFTYSNGDQFVFEEETIHLDGGEHFVPNEYGLMRITATRPVVVVTHGQHASSTGWETTLKYVP